EMDMYVVKVDLKTIRFTSDHQELGSQRNLIYLNNPDNATFEDGGSRRTSSDVEQFAEWVTSGVYATLPAGRNDPITQTKGTSLALNMKLCIIPTGLNFRVKGLNAQGSVTFEATGSSTGVDQEVAMTETTTLPNMVTALDKSIQWKVYIENGSTAEVFNTTSGPHKIFVLWGVPQTVSSKKYYSQPLANTPTVKRMWELTKTDVAGNNSDISVIATAVQAWRDDIPFGDSVTVNRSDGNSYWALKDETTTGQCHEGSVLMEMAMRLLGIDAKCYHVYAIETLPALIEDANGVAYQDNGSGSLTFYSGPLPVARIHGSHGAEHLLMDFDPSAGFYLNLGEGCCEVDGKFYTAFAEGVVGAKNEVTSLDFDPYNTDVTAQSAPHSVLLQLEAAKREFQKWRYVDENGYYAVCSGFVQVPH
ncbi:MAG: hypothetical protein PHT33_15620, partial [bacterium]|nr:hypothetical protein [bacterium]